MQSYSPWKWNKSGKKTLKTLRVTKHMQNKQIVSQMQSYSNQINADLNTNKNGNLKEIHNHKWSSSVWMIP